jgi:hypothetical protein
MSIER